MNPATPSPDQPLFPALIAPQTLTEVSGLGLTLTPNPSTSSPCDRLRVGEGSPVALGGVPREQKMLKGHLLKIIYHQVLVYQEQIHLFLREVCSRSPPMPDQLCPIGVGQPIHNTRDG